MDAPVKYVSDSTVCRHYINNAEGCNGVSAKTQHNFGYFAGMMSTHEVQV